MKNYEFTLILADLAELTDDLERAVLKAGCDDALLGCQNGAVYLDFDRTAKSFFAAVVSAIVYLSKQNLRVARIEPDDLVSASDMSRRLGRTRASVSQLIKGDRGPGSFPIPTARVRQNAPFWKWSEVVIWLSRHGLFEEPDEVEKARTIAFLNSALDISRLNNIKSQGANKTMVKQFLKTLPEASEMVKLEIV